MIILIKLENSYANTFNWRDFFSLVDLYFCLLFYFNSIENLPIVNFNSNYFVLHIISISFLIGIIDDKKYKTFIKQFNFFIFLI